MRLRERQILANRGRRRGPDLREFLASTLDGYRFPRTTSQLLASVHESFDRAIDKRAVRRALAVLRARGVVVRMMTRGNGLTASFKRVSS